MGGLKRSAKLNPAQEDLQRRATILLQQLEEDKSEIVVPTVVVAELLAPVDPQKHGDFIAELRRRFICPPLDLQSASVAAELWQKHRKLPSKERLKRLTLKADALIVATAKVAGARVFYSHDPKCRRLARLVDLESKDLPTHHENLFIDHELGRPGE
ncbi:MAG: PIN domain-containing protein [Planctomycetes bacterium]|nr:PIN domain-containing protein [Planctomycetota bacterium]